MTKQQLLERVSAQITTSHGHYKVTITYRNKEYTCISTNSLAYDAHKDDDSPMHYTQKEALMALYEECKRKNNLR